MIVIEDRVVILKEPTIPSGFKYIEGTLSTGYVIQNIEDGNEFVWVPVPDGTFKREVGYLNNSIDTQWSLDTFIEPYVKDGYTAEKEEYNAMKSSVQEYGGFYIGRYEASDNGSGVAQSIENQPPWYNISWGASMTDIDGDGAAGLSRSVYPDSVSKGEGEAVSTLVYGVQWDATLNWLSQTYPNIKRDSRNYGNYENENVINTGINADYELNHIYDLAGNVPEWTMEACYSDRVNRGGNYYENGLDYPISYRDHILPNSGGMSYKGFRLALYIK